MRPVSTAGVSGLLVISMIAVAAPVVAAGVQRARVPDVVIEIVAGIVVGPSVLGWVKIDQPVGLVALLGLAFLLFLAGLEVDLKVITPSRLRAPLAGYAASLLLGSAAGFAFRAAGWVRSPSTPSPLPWPSSSSSSLITASSSPAKISRPSLMLATGITFSVHPSAL
jgi:Kef-type K+ transport system membrane component KefB